MKSMTGFGRVSSRSTSGAQKATQAVELEVSVRAINGRYLETRVHLPREYAGMESDLKAIVAASFSRGTLDVYINRTRAAGRDTAEVLVHASLAKKWLKAYRQLGKELKLEDDLTLETLTRVPEILYVQEQEEANDAEKKLLKKLLASAVEACDRERVREGKALEAELLGLCNKLEDLTHKMEAMKAEANAELGRRFTERLQKLGLEGRVDEQRVAQEIVIQLDRADVAEEIARLREHLKAYKQLLKSAEPQGKKLDFYAQELLREVNTIGSKSHIARLTNLVVEAKTLVERIREQVQNVE